MARWLNSTPGTIPVAWGNPARLLSFVFGFVTGVFGFIMTARYWYYVAIKRSSVFSAVFGIWPIGY